MRLPSRWECAVQEKERDGKESMGDAPSATGIAQISVQSPGQRLAPSGTLIGTEPPSSRSPSSSPTPQLSDIRPISPNTTATVFCASHIPLWSADNSSSLMTRGHEPGPKPVLNPRKGEVTNLQDVPTMAHPLSAGAAAPHSVRIRRRHRGKPSLISPSSRTVADIAIHDGNDAKIETRRANRRGARKRDASASFQHIRAPIARKNGLKGVGGEGITKPSKTPPQGPPTRRFSAPLGCLSGALCLGWREADAYLAESESGRCARHTNTKGSHRLSGDFQDLTRTPADDILSHQASTHIIARQNLEASSPTEQAERRRCAKRRRLAQRLGPSRTKTQILQRLDNAYPNLPQDTAPSEPRRDSARVSKIATSNTEFAARTCARAQGFFGTLHKAQRPTHIAGSDQRRQRKRPFDEAAAVTSVRHFVRGVVELAEQQVPPPKPLHFSCRGRGTRKREAEPRARLDVFGRITLVKILTKRRVLASFLSLASPVSS
ncbi:hypothetical protein EV122DRAFT_248495 [Schizophyllum commune]